MVRFWKGLAQYCMAGTLFAIFLYVVWFVFLCIPGESGLEMCQQVTPW